MIHFQSIVLPVWTKRFPFATFSRTNVYNHFVNRSRDEASTAMMTRFGLLVTLFGTNFGVFVQRSRQ